MNDQRTDEELNRIIAEWMGWKPQSVYTTQDHDGTDIVCKGGQPRPNYCRDLNACHEAENKWCEQDGPMDVNHPRYLLGHTLYNVIVPYTEQPFRATARQRAEALVRVIEKEGK